MRARTQGLARIHRHNSRFEKLPLPAAVHAPTLRSASALSARSGDLAHQVGSTPGASAATTLLHRSIPRYRGSSSSSNSINNSGSSSIAIANTCEFREGSGGSLADFALIIVDVRSNRGEDVQVAPLANPRKDVEHAASDFSVVVFQVCYGRSNGVRIALDGDATEGLDCSLACFIDGIVKPRCDRRERRLIALRSDFGKEASSSTPDLAVIIPEMLHGDSGSSDSRVPLYSQVNKGTQRELSYLGMTVVSALHDRGKHSFTTHPGEHTDGAVTDLPALMLKMPKHGRGTSIAALVGNFGKSTKRSIANVHAASLEACRDGREGSSVAATGDVAEGANRAVLDFSAFVFEEWHHRCKNTAAIALHGELGEHGDRNITDIRVVVPQERRNCRDYFDAALLKQLGKDEDRAAPNLPLVVFEVGHDDCNGGHIAPRD
eukprot:NODE_7764_length_1552_cov_5.252632.p2 GENE.NODE_7764_length_1552_cov_5.252632~~NODE_7764_length_1552_cov_5.252632.p2  ORF type:complete len:434 (+),score=99.59 NODE_7764_length_1552_cov_5.252632:52-1353(+)